MMSQEEIRAHLDQVYAGIRMREIKKQLRVEYRPDVAVRLRAELKAATKTAIGNIPAVKEQPQIELLSDVTFGLADIGR